MRSKTPPDTVIYAIGDIHGRLDLLAAIHDRIATDAQQRAAQRKLVVYLGDYVSRGEDSRRVVDRVLEWLPEGFERITLKGNHEDLLLRFLGGDPDAGRHWFDYDGLDALAHYGVAIPDRQTRDDATVAVLRDRFAAALPQSHLDFFRSLPA
ncbi:MAG: metallophosphoesterase, partial [Rhodocyclales bacterium]|nr:metallophosphoesterase [Rhodocyclales bacterium]